MPILGWLVTGALVAGRISGAFLVMPGFGSVGVPPLVRILGALCLTAIIAPLLPPLTAPPTLTLLVWGMTTEVFLGVLLGGTVRLAFGAIALAGELFSVQIGHGAAIQYDPSLQISQGPLGILSTLLATACFFGADLHLVMVRNIARSFQVVAAGGATNLTSASTVWLDISANIIAIGMQLSAPLLVMVFLLNFFTGVVTRIAPAMNAFFSLGMVLTVSGGMVVFTLALPHMLGAHLILMEEAIGAMSEILIRAIGG